MCYLYTLDSHDCYGRFASRETARLWAAKRNMISYQILSKPPHSHIVVLNPEMIAAFRN